MENKVPDVTGMFRREDRRVLRISRTYLSSEGKKYTRTELVRNDKVIDAYKVWAEAYDKDFAIVHPNSEF